MVVAEPPRHVSAMGDRHELIFIEDGDQNIGAAGRLIRRPFQTSG
jgi:hypothetical protein